LNKIYTKDWYVSAFKEIESRLNGESKTEFHRIRKDAIDRFIDLDFPTTRLEEWKYTNVSPIFKYNFQPDETVSAVGSDVIEELKIKNLTGNLIVLSTVFIRLSTQSFFLYPRGQELKALHPF
jgi:Fe-S cluster assembly protein SufD